jgi:hypothetical protein
MAQALSRAVVIGALLLAATVVPVSVPGFEAPAASALEPPPGAPRGSVEVPYTFQAFSESVLHRTNDDGDRFGWCYVAVRLVFPPEYLGPWTETSGVLYEEWSRLPRQATSVVITRGSVIPPRYIANPSPGPGQQFAPIVAPASSSTLEQPGVYYGRMDGAGPCSPGSLAEDASLRIAWAESQYAGVRYWSGRNPNALKVTVDVFDDEGRPVVGQLSTDKYLVAEVTIENNSDERLNGLTLQGGSALRVDSRSPGGVVARKIGGTLPSSLAEGAEVVLTYELSTVRRGLAAINTRVTATGAESGDDYEHKSSLKVDIEDGEILDAALAQLVAMEAMNRYMTAMYDIFVEQMERRGKQLKKDLRKILSPADFRRWFGGGVSDTDRARAALQGVAPELVDARLPGKNFKGYTVEELNAAYDKAFADEVGKGVSEWAQNWKKLGKSAKQKAQDAYGEALLSSFYMLGNATPQERMEFEAKMVDLADSMDRGAINLVTTVQREAPRWRENGVYLNEAVEKVIDDALLRSPDLQKQLAQETKARQNLLKLADTDPERFQQEWAKRDAEIFNLGVPLILDTVLGGGVSRLGGAVITKTGVGVARSGDALGVVKNGQKVKAPRTGVPITGEGGIVAADRAAESFLKKVDGATMVRASDKGNTYKMPNAGGVPEVTLDVKAGILKDLEAEYAAATGKNLDLVEVLKPGSEYRKPNGVAKLELTEQKTGKPAMLDAGAPPDVLGEAAVWRSPVSPDKTVQYRFWNKARQQTAMKEWRKANDEWAKWQNPDAGSKTARLKQCIGEECLVPLDLKPWPTNRPGETGLQRFVQAEYETVEVTKGRAEGLLIRVKSYKVVTKVNGKTVNTKTVVKRSEVARPQTPDADAVAVAKQVGVDAKGRPKLAPLSRSEREFVMQRYVDKNIKARKAGLLPDAAEHGTTMVMDDASSLAAGKLLPAYGAPFMPAKAGTDYLRRIARFVAPDGVSADEMFATMLAKVQSEGGFGQHAVVLTKDTRYLGEVLVENW